MLNSIHYRVLRNGECNQTSNERIMSHHGSSDKTAIRSSTENADREISDVQTLIQKAVNEQVRQFFAPLTRQIEELTRLVQGMITFGHLNSYIRAEFGTTSGTAMPQSDMVTGVHRTRYRRRSITSPDTDDETAYPEYYRRF